MALQVHSSANPGHKQPNTSYDVDCPLFNARPNITQNSVVANEFRICLAEHTEHTHTLSATIHAIQIGRADSAENSSARQTLK